MLFPWHESWEVVLSQEFVISLVVSVYLSLRWRHPALLQ